MDWRCSRFWRGGKRRKTKVDGLNLSPRFEELFTFHSRWDRREKWEIWLEKILTSACEAASRWARFSRGWACRPMVPTPFLVCFYEIHFHFQNLFRRKTDRKLIQLMWKRQREKRLYKKFRAEPGLWLEMKGERWWRQSGNVVTYAVMIRLFSQWITGLSWVCGLNQGFGSTDQGK